MSSIRERLAALSRAELIGLIVLAAGILAAASFWYLRSLPHEVPIQITGATTVPGAAVTAPGTPAVASSPSAASAGPGLVVHVAGWVQHPGVFELDAGSRAIDAVERAGGPRRGAVLEGLNLAAVLTDGQQLLIPGPTAPRVAGAPAPVDGTSSKVNVNTADTAELEELPGIGEVLAQAIVEHREDQGPFTAVEDLLDVSGIGDATLEDIRPEITV